MSFSQLTSVQDEIKDRHKLNQPIYTWEDWRYYATDDPEDKAWKAGFLHSYRGIDAGWTDEETMEMYKLGLRDGAAELERTLARGEPDPRKW